MERLAKRLAYRIATSLSFDDEKEAVVAYGLFAILQISLTIALVLIMGLIFNTLVEGLLVCLSASILRKYSGGVHAVAAGLCTTISIFYCTITAVISSRLLAVIYEPKIVACILAVVYLLAYIIIYKKAPVDSPNKPIKSTVKIKRMRVGCFVTISVYLFLSVGMFLLSFWFDDFKSYGVSILFGVAWQIFTLTRPAFKLIGGINHLYILTRKEVGS